VRRLLIGVAVGFLALLLVMPLVVVFAEALAHGVGAYLHSFANADMQAALRLTALVTGIAVPANVVFGVTAAWLVTRHEFVGKSVLTTLIDLPFSVSPVIAGFIYVLLFGKSGLLGPVPVARTVRTYSLVAVARSIVALGLLAPSVASCPSIGGWPSSDRCAPPQRRATPHRPRHIASRSSCNMNPAQASRTYSRPSLVPPLPSSTAMPAKQKVTGSGNVSRGERPATSRPSGLLA